MYKKTAYNLLSAINECTCSFTTVLYAKEKLQEAGFRELELKNMAAWDVHIGDKFFIEIYDSSLFAFTVGAEFEKNSMVRLIAAHTDSPALYIKPNPEVTAKKYGKINVEIYGGAILNTWLDRPLSVSGKIALKGESEFSPDITVIDLQKNLFTIPNLAIHLNRDINKGMELNRQKDMMPICTIIEDELNKEDFFMNYIAEEMDVNKEDILDFELYIYNGEDGCMVGLSDDMISAPRLDNITSVNAAINAIKESERANGINGIMLYDNEEIGSRSKQGADSILFSLILERIYTSLGASRNEYLSAITNGFMISMDVAHAYHPNHSEKSDITNVNPMNYGVVIKRASSQSYGTDCESIAIIEQICKKGEIPYQKFESRSDVSTGSTLGNIAGKYAPMRVVDVGVPILAMHSARELMGAKDQFYLEELAKKFFVI